MLQVKLAESKKSSIALKGDRKPSNTTRSSSYKNSSKQIDIQSFDEILAITDTYAWIEPKVTMEKLCKETLKHGLIPPVVPEFKNITAGGAVMGSGLESSSYRYGQFCDQCFEYEVLLGDGTQLTLSAAENSDLFYGLSGSYGSLAIIVALKIRLMPAKQAVTLTCHHFKSIPDGLEKIESLRYEHNSDFIEGIAYNPSHCVIIEGRYSDDKPNYKMSTVSSKWFYQTADESTTIIMPTFDYIFRYDLGAFWMGAYLNNLSTIRALLTKKKDPKVLAQIDKPTYPSWSFRLQFNRLLSCANLYKALHMVSEKTLANLFVIQDFYIPADKAFNFILPIMDIGQIWPLWLCPIKKTNKPKFLSPNFSSDHNFINVGVYGKPQKSIGSLALTKLLEHNCDLVGGRKMLYGQTYIPEEEFWKIYDKNQYEELRKKYHAETFIPLNKKIITK
ncbi:MAG: FAD-binding oxidoreductase [Parachlamydiales bacterium]|nr:FAD-binding oxidoreductase [Parachlamydiales bacterium]